MSLVKQCVNLVRQFDFRKEPIFSISQKFLFTSKGAKGDTKKSSHFYNQIRDSPCRRNVFYLEGVLDRLWNGLRIVEMFLQFNLKFKDEK